jgi:hypothetical protein
VAPGDLRPTLEKARGIAGEFGAAILRVSLSPGGPRVVVEPPARHDTTVPAPPNQVDDPETALHLERRVPAAMG